MVSMRLAQEWDEFNDHRINKNRLPENVILRGIVDDFRRQAMKSLLIGIVEIVNFG